MFFRSDAHFVVEDEAEKSGKKKKKRLLLFSSIKKKREKTVVENSSPLSAQAYIFPSIDLLEMTLLRDEEGKRPRFESQTTATAAAERRQREERPLLAPARGPLPLPPFLLPPAAPFPAPALQARDEGNEAMRSGDFTAAVVSYSRALLSLLESEKEEEENDTRLARALVLSNRAAARLSLGRFSKAAADSLQAIELCPFWWRPWARLARARAGAGDASGGVRACREGSEAAAAPASASAEATKSGLPSSSLPARERLEAQAALRREADAIALAAAHEGRFDGFDGAVLEVSRKRTPGGLVVPCGVEEGKKKRRKKEQKTRKTKTGPFRRARLRVARPPRPSSRR